MSIQPHRCINLPEIADPNPAKPCEVFWLLTCPWQFNRASLLHSYMQLVWKLEETRFFCEEKNPGWLMRSSWWGFAPLIFQPSLRLHQVGWILLGLLLHALTQAIPGATCRNRLVKSHTAARKGCEGYRKLWRTAKILSYWRKWFGTTCQALNYILE